MKDEDFKMVVEVPCTFGSFPLQDGFLFQGNKFCIPKSSLKDLTVNDTYRGVLVNHFAPTTPLRYLRSIFIDLRCVEMSIR